jgi:hypothetical protein
MPSAGERGPETAPEGLVLRETRAGRSAGSLPPRIVKLLGVLEHVRIGNVIRVIVRGRPRF